MQQLTRGQQDTCTYTGIFGAMLGATCLIQLFAITREHWISGVMILVVIFSIISYILLSLQKSFSPILLLVAGLLVFALNFFHDPVRRILTGDPGLPDLFRGGNRRFVCRAIPAKASCDCSGKEEGRSRMAWPYLAYCRNSLNLLLSPPENSSTR